MFLPLGTERARRRPTVITYWLIGMCAGIFVMQMIMRAQADGAGNPPLWLNWMLWPTSSRGVDFQWWQLVSYQFLHGSWLHLLGNMLFLYVFGPPVEDRFRRLPFAAFYLVGGIAAGSMHLLFQQSPVLGASGSIAAVTGAFLVLFPLVGIRLLLFFFIIGVYTIPAWWFIGAAIAFDMFFAASDDGVARLAHIGGYLYGAGIAMVLLWAKVLPREPYDLFSMGRQAHRRRQFRELTSRQSAWLHDAAKARKPSSHGDGQGSARAKKTAVREEALAQGRAEVVQAMSSGAADTAVSRYDKLLDAHADAVLSRQQQLDIGNFALGAGKHQLAAAAYELYLKHWPSLQQSAEVQLLLAVVNARYLNDPVRAKALLKQINPAMLSPEHNNLRAQLLGELG